jgi:hypothetical protein
MSNIALDEKYLEIILQRIEICKAYKPKFGQGKSVSLEEFEVIYRNDSFYSWFGLNDPLIYAAHKAAGGITSLYRQIGLGCETVFREVIREQLMLNPEQARWSYKVKGAKDKERTLSLDARIETNHINDAERREKFQQWFKSAAQFMNLDANVARALKGAVFEVRQGYKSKDSKRQNADVGNAGSAYANGYLPIVAVLSSQIDNDIVIRYRNAGWLLLLGNLNPSPLVSVYSFCKEVLDYDLAGFFERNSPKLQTTVSEIMQALLSPESVELPKEVQAVIDKELATGENEETGI